MDNLAPFLIVLLIIFRVPLLIFLAPLFMVLLATGVFVYLVCKGILRSLVIPQKKGYVLNILKMAVEHTAWGFIVPWTVLCVLTADLKSSLKKAP